MSAFRTATVTEVISGREGLQRIRVEMADRSSARAYVLTQLVGDVAAGDRVVLNTTAVDLDLGTGGWHFVHWNLSRSELVSPGPDHIMKLRYTSLQVDVGTDELAHPEVDRPLGSVPVAVCSVHSQVAAVAAAFAAAGNGMRLVYVMTDGASLPIAMSDLVAAMTDADLLAATVTAGHAFGGDMEAVTVPAAIGLAVHALGADAVVVGMGPGVVGTGTALGTTAIEAAPILDAVAALGGTPVFCVRASDGDPRPRHHGISHHSETICALTSSRPWIVASPPQAADLPGVRVATGIAVPEPVELLDSVGLRVTTMGRQVSEDRMFFRSAAAAGALLAAIASDPSSERWSGAARPDAAVPTSPVTDAPPRTP